MPIGNRAAALLLLLAVPLSSVATAGETPPLLKPGETVPDLRLKDLEGREWSLRAQAGKKAIVFAMLSTGCPLSNSYLEPLNDLARRRGAEGVLVAGINANPGETPAEIKSHQKEYSIGFPVLLDPDQAALRALGARVNSEVFLLDGSFTLRYRGRFDDGYSSRLRRKARVGRRDLEAALDEVLAGKQVSLAVTEALGCAIVSAQRPAAAAAPSVTFNRDVMPILQARCQECHRPGEVAPFSLLSYRDAERWGEDIAEVVRSRKMPPWKPGDHGALLRSERQLTEEESRSLIRWCQGGMVEGDPKELPPPRSFPEGWRLGEPDLALEIPAEMTIGPSGKDLFRVFVLPTGLTEDRYVTAIEVRPGNKRVVHHTLQFIDTHGRARGLEEAAQAKEEPASRQDHGPGYTVAMGIGFLPNEGGLGGWAPGNILRHLPEGVGYHLPAGSDVVVQIHYHRSGKLEKDRTRIGLHFAKKPVRQQIRSIVVPGLLTVIPAGEERHLVRGAIEVRQDADLYTITPHMHLLGKQIRARVVRPDGPPEELIAIPEWDYNWQETYFFKEPLHLTSGCRLEVEATFDNSEKNPLNPNQPPRPVRFGEQTTDEMCFVFFGATSEKPGRIRVRAAFGALSGERAAARPAKRAQRF
jgi:peroxiredoxin